MKYTWEPGMDDVSGLGGSHEAGTRCMILAGAAYLDERPGCVFEYGRDILDPTSKDAILLQAEIVMAAGENSPTGWMLGCAVNHVLFIAAEGWPAYVEMMRARRVLDPVADEFADDLPF